MSTQLHKNYPTTGISPLNADAGNFHELVIALIQLVLYSYVTPPIFGIPLYCSPAFDGPPDFLSCSLLFITDT